MSKQGTQTSDQAPTPPTPTNEILVAFNDGSYKKVKHIEWKHSQWIHFTKANGKQVHVNPKNVNYMEDQ